MKDKLKLYLVTHRSLMLGRELEKVVADAVAGGVTMVQLREKEASTGEFVSLAGKLKNLLRPLGIPLIINDRVDVALAVDADGVHIGQSDMSYVQARKLLGKDKIIGLSVETPNDIIAANALDVDYIAISPVYGTATKTDTAVPFGIEGLRNAVRLSVHPTVAIGGMNMDTASEVMQTGCDGIAVVSAICSAANPQQAASELKDIVVANTVECWSRNVWRASARIYDAILEHKFIKELSNGTLSMERFARYIGQDELYLKNYYRYLFELAEMIDKPREREFFREFAQKGMEGEKVMHEFLIGKYGINADAEPSEVTLRYNSLIELGIKSGNKCVAMSSMLPCMWIYNRVGLHILQTAVLESNPYREWIVEYGNEEFTNGVNKVLDMIDNWARNADEDTRKRMSGIYLEAALCEYAFWDYGYYGGVGLYSYLDSLEEWL